jgi:hypothetical protein
MNGSDEKLQKYERKVRRDRLWTFVSAAEFVVGFFLRRVGDVACDDNNRNNFSHQVYK